jgi:hypothetical protein
MKEDDHRVTLSGFVEPGAQDNPLVNGDQQLCPPGRPSSNRLTTGVKQQTADGGDIKSGVIHHGQCAHRRSLPSEMSFNAP